MKDLFIIILLYVILIIAHLLIMKIDELKKIKEQLNMPNKLNFNKKKEQFETLDKIFDETMMKQDLLSFIEEPMQSFSQEQEQDYIYKPVELDDEPLNIEIPTVTENRIKVIDELQYENDKMMNTGNLGNGLNAYDDTELGFASF